MQKTNYIPPLCFLYLAIANRRIQMAVAHSSLLAKYLPIKNYLIKLWTVCTNTAFFKQWKDQERVNVATLKK